MMGRKMAGRRTDDFSLECSCVAVANIMPTAATSIVKRRVMDAAWNVQGHSCHPERKHCVAIE